MGLLLLLLFEMHQEAVRVVPLLLSSVKLHEDKTPTDKMEGSPEQCPRAGTVAISD